MGDGVGDGVGNAVVLGSTWEQQCAAGDGQGPNQMAAGGCQVLGLPHIQPRSPCKGPNLA